VRFELAQRYRFGENKNMRSAAATGLALLLCVSANTASGQTASAGGASVDRFTFGAEALVWWLKDSPAPVPLITDGILGEPGTHTLLGGHDIGTGANPGFRLTGGYALNDRWRLEGNVFYLVQRSTAASVASTGAIDSTDLVIPYIDAATNNESGTQVSFAPVYNGSARAELTNDFLGAEVNAARALKPVGRWQMEALGGFRYLRLHENYRFTTRSPYNPPFPVDIWDTSDEFDTTNNFYGVQAGLRARFDQGQFFADTSIKVALGAMNQSAGVHGSLVTNDYTGYGPTQTFSGGYFALASNVGNYSRTVFAAVPEFALNLGYHITPNATVIVGYSFIYASNVSRPGNQMSRTINPTQSTAYTEDPASRLNDPAQPAFRFNDSSFWAQGMNVGLAVRF
jgi:hypothetical protein